MKNSWTELIRLHEYEYRIRHWGESEAPMLFMIHGWLDSAVSFQFVIDALQKNWHVIAPDLRGHGQSHRNNEAYFFMQYIADLDALFDYFSPVNPVRVVGHSLGGNVASIYAGCRPDRISHLVNLEGLAPVPGLNKGTPQERVSNWLTRLRKGVSKRSYVDQQELTSRLRQANPRLSLEHAQFLAEEFGQRELDGLITLDVDRFQYVQTPTFGLPEVIDSVWAQISAPVLLVTGSDSYIFRAFDPYPQELERRFKLVQHLRHVNIEDAGHNLHHDQPSQIAALLDEFLAI